MDNKITSQNEQPNTENNINSGNTPKSPVYKPPVEKPRRKRSKAPLVLSIILSFVVVLCFVLFVLFLIAVKDNLGFLNFPSKQQAIVENISESDALTEASTEKQTEKPTKAPTEAPTEKPTKGKDESSDNNEDDFDSYKVTLYPYTYIYDGPGYSYECVETLDEQGIYTIVDECYDTASGSKWGKLKSGAGWVNLDNNYNYDYSYSSYTVNPYLVTLYPPTYIYDGPGYQYECVMTLEEQGVYTIVEEQYNTSTNSTWGRLKSGVGWVNLD